MLWHFDFRVLARSNKAAFPDHVNVNEQLFKTIKTKMLTRPGRTSKKKSRERYAASKQRILAKCLIISSKSA